MKTKARILERGRELFNEKGIKAVSLRDIAKSLGISYGNLTYHYSDKENLLTWIYIQMMEDHQEITKNHNDFSNKLEKLLHLTENVFEISFKYLFLFQDYVEILRNYPSIAEMQKQIIHSGKSDLFNIFVSLREQGLLRSDIGDQEIDYLLELGNDMRSFYFMKLTGIPLHELNKNECRKAYALFMNRLFYPYFTAKGLKIYHNYSAG